MTSFVRTIKNKAGGYSNTQIRVRNATSNDINGPNVVELQEIAQLTYSLTDRLDVLEIVERRLNDKGKNWRHVAKTLQLLDYLLHYGDEGIVDWTRQRLFEIKTLREFLYVDDSGLDQGVIIRTKAKDIVSLILDKERLQKERQQSRATLNTSSSIYNAGVTTRGTGSSTYTQYSRPSGVPPSSNSTHPPPEVVANVADGDEELRRALEESKKTAELEAQRRQAQAEDDDLQKALRLSKEEELANEKRLRDAETSYKYDLTIATNKSVSEPEFSLLDMDSGPSYPQAIQSQSSTGLRMGSMNPFPNPESLQPLNTGYLNGLYSNPMSTQSNMNAPQTSNFVPNTNMGTLQPSKTGSRNPFSLPSPTNAQSSTPISHSNSPFVSTANTPSSPINDHYSDLNALLANSGEDGIDTFGNSGELRIPAQHTVSTGFVNSAGTGAFQQQPRQINNNPPSPIHTNNPFFNVSQQQQQQQQSAPTTYGGYGNQVNGSPSTVTRENNSNNLIDI